MTFYFVKQTSGVILLPHQPLQCHPVSCSLHCQLFLLPEHKREKILVTFKYMATNTCPWIVNNLNISWKHVVFCTSYSNYLVHNCCTLKNARQWDWCSKRDNSSDVHQGWMNPKKRTDPDNTGLVFILKTYAALAKYRAMKILPPAPRWTFHIYNFFNDQFQIVNWSCMYISTIGSIFSFFRVQNSEVKN